MNKKVQELSKEELDINLAYARVYDPKALAKLCEHYLPKIYQYVFYRVNRREDAEDLTNEICIKAIRNIRSQKGSFEAWLFRIASNMITDFYRRRGVRRKFEVHQDESQIVEERSGLADQLLTQAELKQALLQLTDEQQEIITLKFIEGFGNDEIAEMLGKSVGAIRALQFRALGSLRQLLSEKGSLEEEQGD